jgi:hypothetical protein
MKQSMMTNLQTVGFTFFSLLALRRTRQRIRKQSRESIWLYRAGDMQRVVEGYERQQGRLKRGGRFRH